ncbi:MAG TPA: mannosyltransferase family protein, partial [Acidimicrobiales bacterium]|nr:mannosyltransferase family protein [Acidimicrobiales bacterium]
LRPAAIYLTARVVGLLAAVATGILHPGNVGTPGLPAPWLQSAGVPLGRSLLVWDSRWYLDIARNGYPSAIHHAGSFVPMNGSAFLPLLPETIRALNDITGLSFGVSGLLLCSIYALIGAIVIWALCRDLWGEAAATRACALFCFFPGAFIFNFVYTEALLVALAAGCLFSLYRQRWVIAGVLAGLATATHAAGLALVFACAWAAAVALYRHRDWSALSAPVLAPMGFLGYLAYLQVHTGSFRTFFISNAQGFGERFSLAAPWTRLTDLVGNPSGSFAGAPGWPPSSIMETINLVGLAFFVVAVVLLVRSRVPGSFLWYTGVVVFLNLFSMLGGLHPRFLLAAFPLVIGLGNWLRGVWYQATLVVFGSLMVALTVATVGTMLVVP